MKGSGLKNVRISVVMSVYNGEKYLKEAIDSILLQTFREFEFIIIDDGSSDGSADIIKGYKDSRIRFFQQRNIGLAASLNRGVSLASANLIARMDQDDISLPRRFEQQYEYLQLHKDVIALGTAAEWVDMNGDFVCIWVPPCSESDINEVLPNTPFSHPTVFFRKEYFEKVEGYPSGFKYAPEDSVLFNRLAGAGRLANISEPLLKYRLTPDSTSAGHSLNKKLMQNAIYKEIHGEMREQDYLKLEKMAHKVSFKMKLSVYYSLLARLFLLEQGKKVKCLNYTVKSICCYPWRINPYALILLTLVPRSWAMRVYKKSL